MTRSEALRDLYEALDLLDAAQRGGPRPAPVAVTPVGPVATSVPTSAAVDGPAGSGGIPGAVGGAGAVGLYGADGWVTGGEPLIDLREPPAGGGTVLPTAGGLRHQVRLRLGTDWDSTGRRHGTAPY